MHTPKEPRLRAHCSQAARTPRARHRVMVHWAPYRGPFRPCRRRLLPCRKRLLPCRRMHSRAVALCSSPPSPSRYKTSYRDTGAHAARTERRVVRVAEFLRPIAGRCCAVSQPCCAVLRHKKSPPCHDTKIVS